MAAHSPLPSLVLMTDDDRLPDPLPAVRALPRGSMVIVRARESAKRETLTRATAAIARTRGLTVLVAGDPSLARHVHGLHLPEAHAASASYWRARHPHWIITVSSHGSSRPPTAADAVILSNVFSTASHPGRAGLGPFCAAAVARAFNKPVYALGGIDSLNAARLPGAFSGIAAIGALSI